MTSDYKPINDKACNVGINDLPTIGAFIHGTLDMQAETLEVIRNIARIMWGDEITTPVYTPEENIMAGLAAILENQRAIMTDVKAIVDKL